LVRSRVLQGFAAECFCCARLTRRIIDDSGGSGNDRVPTRTSARCRGQRQHARPQCTAARHRHSAPTLATIDRHKFH